MLPLICWLLLDAQFEFLRAADAVPDEAKDKAPTNGLNTGGWVVAHAGFFHDVWINCDAEGGRPDDACDPWLLAWFRRQRDSDLGNLHAGRGHGRLAKTIVFIESLTDARLGEVPAYAEGAWPPGTTLGYFVARDIAHLFAHASELAVIINAGGGREPGLPGRLARTRGDSP